MNDYTGFRLRLAGVIPGLGLGDWYAVIDPSGALAGYTGPGCAEFMAHRGAVIDG